MVTWRHLLVKDKCLTCNCGEDSSYVVIGLPMDWTTTYMPGTRFAPQSIREASCNIELYSLITGKCLEKLRVNDLGDIALPYGDVYSSIRNIEQVVRGLLEDYRKHIYFFLGGEHLVSYPIIKALRNNIDHVVVFDAHGDLRDEYIGLKYSHATVFKRVLDELSIPVSIIGVRALSSEEIEFIKNNNLVKVFPPNKITTAKIPQGKNIYISIDMDVIDPGYAPGVSNPEALGITPHQLIDILTKIISENNIVGIDIVEVNPLRDINNVTSILAAKIIIEIIGLLDSR